MTDNAPRATAPPAVTERDTPSKTITPPIITAEQAERIIALLEAMAAQLAQLAALHRLAPLPAPAP